MRSFVRWRRGGRRRPPCGWNSKGLVLFDAPFSFAGPDRFQSFLCQGHIPTSGVNKWSPQLIPPGPPALTQGRRPAPPHCHSTSSFRFLLPLFSQQAPPALGGCVRPPEQGPGCMPDPSIHQWLLPSSPPAKRLGCSPSSWQQGAVRGLWPAHLPALTLGQVPFNLFEPQFSVL